MISRVKNMDTGGLLVKCNKVSKEEFCYTIEDSEKEIIFKSKPLISSANLCNFFGICHAISILEDGIHEPLVHTNNMTALCWVVKKDVNTVIEDEEMLEYIHDSINYLNDLEMEYECLHYSWKK